MLFNILVISISVSIDALGIGISYKVKGVKVPFLAKLIIGLISAAVMFGAVFLGGMMLEFFPSKVANILGISILALMGVEFIRKGLFGSEEATYDFDKSKEIELWEAFVLGFALSADSISAGIGAATIGLNSMLIPITVGCMQVFFLSIGEVLIGHCSLVNKMSQKVCGLISGFMLLLIAIIRIISI